MNRSTFPILMMSLLFLSVLVPACDHSNPVAEYGNTLMDAHQRAKVGADQANLEIVRAAVNAYRAANGELPKRLEDVESFIGGNRLDLSKYSYDPETGAVNVKP